MNFDFKQKPIGLRTALTAVVLGLLVGAIFILITGRNPITVYHFMLQGAVGSQMAIASTLRWSTPLLFAGLAATIAFRGGMFNFGIEGQLYMGALAAALAGIYFAGLPRLLLLLVCFLAAMVAGMAWAALPAFVRVKLGGNEAVPALMLNFIAMYLCDFLVQRFFLPGMTFGQTMATGNIAEHARLSRLMPPHAVTSGFFIAIAFIIVAYFFFKHTKSGYNVSMTGINAEFAKYGGINVHRIRIKVMLISGMIAGMCGATEVMGVTWRYESGFSPEFGIEGILASLLGGNEPIRLLISALFMGAVKAGSLTVERSAGVPRALADIIQAFIICFVSARLIADYLGIDRIEVWAQKRLSVLWNRFRPALTSGDTEKRGD